MFVFVSTITFRQESWERMTVMVPAQRAGNKDQSLPPDNGYMWRKYGQKNVLGSRYPRYSKVSIHFHHAPMYSLSPLSTHIVMLAKVN